jgi:metal-sulfur cluster biosynthetic enzyme
MNNEDKKKQIIEMLETVIDPELGVDVYTMGLIYEIDIKDDKSVRIVMTFTSPMCPAGEEIKSEVFDSMKILGYESIDVQVTFEPPWVPSQELRDALGV